MPPRPITSIRYRWRCHCGAQGTGSRRRGLSHRGLRVHCETFGHDLQQGRVDPVQPRPTRFGQRRAHHDGGTGRGTPQLQRLWFLARLRRARLAAEAYHCPCCGQARGHALACARHPLNASGVPA